MSSEGYHEPVELLSAESRDLHRAIISLIEEMEAVDWYHQRAQACTDASLRAVLIHNRDEELEHAVMTLEWIRRHLPELDVQARKYLFSEGPITKTERNGSGMAAGGTGGELREARSLRIGSLRGESTASE